MTRKVINNGSLNKNGTTNRNQVRKGFIGTMGWRYHPTKGFRREPGFDPAYIIKERVRARPDALAGV